MIGRQEALEFAADFRLDPQVDTTPPVLKHSFCLLAADLRNSDQAKDSLLGHKAHSVINRYAHGTDSVSLAAADAVAECPSDLMRDAERVDAVSTREPAAA